LAQLGERQVGLGGQQFSHGRFVRCEGRRLVPAEFRRLDRARLAPLGQQLRDEADADREPLGDLGVLQTVQDALDHPLTKIDRIRLWHAWLASSSSQHRESHLPTIVNPKSILSFRETL
jgi:hypothetical protein